MYIPLQSKLTTNNTITALENLSVPKNGSHDILMVVQFPRVATCREGSALFRSTVDSEQSSFKMANAIATRNIFIMTNAIAPHNVFAA